MQTLEDDLAGLGDPNAMGIAARKVVNIQQELLNTICPPWYCMLSGYLLTILIRVAAL